MSTLVLSRANYFILVMILTLVTSCSQNQNRKLLIPIPCTTRKFELHSPRSNQNDRRVRFALSEVDGVSRVLFQERDFQLEN